MLKDDVDPLLQLFLRAEHLHLTITIQLHVQVLRTATNFPIQIITDQIQTHGAHRRSGHPRLTTVAVPLPKVRNRVGIPRVYLLHGKHRRLGQDESQLRLLLQEIDFIVTRWHKQCHKHPFNLLILGRNYTIVSKGSR